MHLRDVRYEVEGAVAVVTLNRPKYRNAQSWRLLDDLDAALDAAMADRAVRVAVVCGEGGHFSAGHDLGTKEQVEDLQERGIPQVGIAEYDAFRKYNLDLTMKWRNLPKPTIAMVEGYCIFGGSSTSPCRSTSASARRRSCSSRAVSSTPKRRASSAL
jgi:enoyl-CoA hydratase